MAPGCALRNPGYVIRGCAALASGKIVAPMATRMNDLRHSLHIAALALTVAIAAATAGATFAQVAPPPPPTQEALPEAGGDIELEPQVTITKRDGETIEEARANGKLLWVKVTPRHGRPYFLIPDSSDFGFIRRESFDTGLKVPMWVLFTF